MLVASWQMSDDRGGERGKKIERVITGGEKQVRSSIEQYKQQKDIFRDLSK